MMKTFWTCIATFFYVGCLPKAPGTWGSLAALPIVFFVREPMPILGLIAVCFVVGRVAAAKVEAAQGVEDPKCVVIDEVVGVFITFFGVYVSKYTLLAGFLLFRFFDIAKPWIIKKVEHVPKGYGIMFDDMIAGVFANIVLRIIIMVVY